MIPYSNTQDKSLFAIDKYTETLLKSAIYSLCYSTS